MNKTVKLLGRKKWAVKGNLEVPEMEFTTFTVLSRARAVPPTQMLYNWFWLTDMEVCIK